MVIRRIILVTMLAALGLCAFGGMLAALTSGMRELWGIVWMTVVAAIALGLMLPLTLLVERPKYRAGGFAAMATIGSAAACLCGIVIVELMRGFSYGVVDVLAAGIGLSFLYGVPTTGALLLVQFKWVRISAWVLTGVSLIALCFAGLAGLMAMVSGRQFTGPFMATSMLLFFCGFLSSTLLVNVGQGDWRLFRFPSIGLAWLAFAIIMVPAWENLTRFRVAEDLWLKGGLIVLLPAIFFAHLNLLLMARVSGFGKWVRTLTIAGSIATMSLIGLAVLSEVEVLIGFAAASGIATACGSLATIVIALLQRRLTRNEEPLADSSMLTDIEIACPRCKKRQVLPLGEPACGGCGLKMVLKAIEPRCYQCGYLLYGTTSNRCPECGVEQTGEAPGVPLPATPA